jgi:hypothetical protein
MKGTTMKIKFPKEPMCEQCGQHSPVAFCYLGPDQGWKFCCHCTDNYDWYYVLLDRFFNSPASTTDWLAHLHGKAWMDWDNFMDMMMRFRSETGSFSQP